MTETDTTIVDAVSVHLRALLHDHPGADRPYGRSLATYLDAACSLGAMASVASEASTCSSEFDPEAAARDVVDATTESLRQMMASGGGCSRGRQGRSWKLDDSGLTLGTRKMLSSHTIGGMHHELPAVVPNLHLIADLAGVHVPGRVDVRRIPDTSDVVVEVASPDGYDGCELETVIRGAGHADQMRLREDLITFAAEVSRRDSNMDCVMAALDRAGKAALRAFGEDRPFAHRVRLRNVVLVRPSQSLEYETTIVLTHEMDVMGSAGIMRTQVHHAADTERGKRDLMHWLRFTLKEHLLNQKTVKRTIEKHGHVPVMDSVSFRILEARNDDVETLARMANSQGTSIPLEGMGRQARFKAKGGRLSIRGELAKGILYAHGRIEIETDLPDTVLNVLSGQTIDQLLHHPALSGEIVATARRSQNKIDINLVPSWTRIDMEDVQ